MPIIRKQKKSRKSRGLEMFSDIENLEIMLCEGHTEREESVNSNLARDLKVPIAISLKTLKGIYT